MFLVSQFLQNVVSMNWCWYLQLTIKRCVIRTPFIKEDCVLIFIYKKTFLCVIIFIYKKILIILSFLYTKNFSLCYNFGCPLLQKNALISQQKANYKPMSSQTAQQTFVFFWSSDHRFLHTRQTIPQKENNHKVPFFLVWRSLWAQSKPSKKLNLPYFLAYSISRKTLYVIKKLNLP